MAVKLMTLVRTDDLTGWRLALTARLADGVQGLVRMLVNTVEPVEVRPSEGAAPERWDAVLEAWFDTRADLDRWIGMQPATALLVDLVVDQKLIHDSGDRAAAAKVIVVFRRRADKTRAEAQAHWRGEHVRLGLVEHNATDFLTLYFQNHVIEGNRAASPAHDYDGLPEYWLDRDALSKVGPDSAVMRAIAKDEENFIDRASIVTLLVEEEQFFVRA
jgi:hypothetical protein